MSLEAKIIALQGLMAEKGQPDLVKRLKEICLADILGLPRENCVAVTAVPTLGYVSMQYEPRPVPTSHKSGLRTGSIELPGSISTRRSVCLVACL